MNVRSFLKLVEIQTKVASVIPFTLGTLYTLYRFKTFNLTNFILFFISLIMFDMATTAINNYMDFKNARKTHGYGYETHNAIVSHGLSEKVVVATICTLVGIAIVFGILLFKNTTMLLLMIGAVSFLIGILYSFGPIPISHTPLGEILSGLCMGLVITFLSIYIHIHDTDILSLSYTAGELIIKANLVELIYIFLLSMPAITGIANIMLANNICDIEDDLENRRYTLPIYIGKRYALILFKSLYYAAYISLILLLAFEVIPLASLVVALTFRTLFKNVKIFYALQSKEKTFILAVKNFVLLNASFAVSIGVGILLRLMR